MNWRWIEYGLKELKFIKSYEDIKILNNQKLPFLFPRLLGVNYRDLPIPPSLQMEPTNICNLNCISCPRDRMTRKKGLMDFSLFKKIIDDAAQIKVKRIHFYLHGEPAIHPQLVEMINYIKKKGIGINLTTNGELFNEIKIRALLEAGINSSDYITFSILGFRKEVHENVMKGVSHEKVLRNIITLMKMRKKLQINGPVIQTVFYTMPENEKDKEVFYEYWRNKVDHVKVVRKISKSFSDFGRQRLDKIPVRENTCKNIWERMTIYWNGDVVLCCEDVGGETIAGNMKDQSIKEIWNSKKLKGLRSLHQNGKIRSIPLCARCDE